jgi:orotate phosphoribosyltransferase-like protein
MSKIAELAYDIEQLYIDGMSAAQIAQELNCPIGIVKGWIEGNSVADTPQEDEIFSPYYGA